MPEHSFRYLEVIKHLPQRDETWFVSVRRPRIFTTEKDGSIIHPYLILVAGWESSLIYNADLVKIQPDSQKVGEILLNAMRRPMKSLRETPHRPAKVLFEQPEMCEALQTTLDEVGVNAGVQEAPGFIDDAIVEIEEQFGDASEDIGLLNVDGVTPELLGELFKAAASYYRAEPWIYLSDEQPLAFKITHPDQTGYAQLLGNAGYEYGLLLYQSWQDLEGAFLASDDPIQSIPDTGWISLTYSPATLIPVEDLEAIEIYGWEIPDPKAYPLPMVFHPDKTVDRPSIETLRIYTALLQAIPVFVNDLQVDWQADYHPMTRELVVTVEGVTRQLSLEYPAGELHREAFPARLSLEHDDEQELEWLGLPDNEIELFEDEIEVDEEEQTDDLLYLDALSLERSMEGEMAKQTGGLISAYPDPSLRQAQELMYQAWGELDPHERLNMARKALEISPDCADAYVLLAEELAVNIGQAKKFYERGVLAGERALGDQYFSQNAGDFWMRLETRPYLRACKGLADVFSDLNHSDQAIELWEKMLRLDLNDSQGARYNLLAELVNLLHNDAAEQLIQRFADDASATWRYNQALLAFRRYGSSEEVRRLLATALQSNKHVLTYLTGRKRLPVDLPEYFQPGDENEAIDYAVGHLNAWRITPGAVDWLRLTAKSEAKTARSTQHKTGPAKPHAKGKKKRH